MVLSVDPRNTKIHFANSRMRCNWIYYLVLLVSSVFVYSFFAVDPSIHCVEYPCPLWLRGFILGLGLLFGLGILIAMIRDHQAGSYIDLQTRKIIWWDSAPPLTYREIEIEKVRELKVDTTGDCDRVDVLLAGDEEVNIPSHCIQAPYHEWCRSISNLNSSIEMTIR